VKTKTFILAACLAAALAAPLSAGIITTGQCAGPSPCTATLDNWSSISNLGTFLDGVTHNVSGVNNEGETVFTGVLRAAVYRSTVSNQLDFYYQYFNNASSLDSISQIQMEKFGSFTTNVGFTSQDIDGATGSAGKVNFSQTGTLQNPSQARRPNTNTVLFDFSTAIAPNAQSRILVIRTNATVYAAGTTTILNGASATYATFAPTDIPEPATFGILGAGLIALGLVRRQRV
jgi:hypothetical protein